MKYLRSSDEKWTMFVDEFDTSYGEFYVVTLFYQTVIDYVYFYEIEFAKLIIRYRYSLMIWC